MSKKMRTSLNLDDAAEGLKSGELGVNESRAQAKRTYSDPNAESFMKDVHAKDLVANGWFDTQEEFEKYQNKLN